MPFKVINNLSTQSKKQQTENTSGTVYFKLNTNKPPFSNIKIATPSGNLSFVLYFGKWVILYVYENKYI